MISRRKVLEGGALAAVMIALPFKGLRKAYGATPSTINYYISPTGDDNNAGTLESPWSITAINNNQAAYAGKVVGFLPGTYQYGTKAGVRTTLYSLIATNPHSPGEALSVQGGASSSSPTYLCSCDQSGNYSPRTAIIDCSNPSDGTQAIMTGSTQAVACFGQIYGHPAPNVSQYGNVVFDGLVIRHFSYSAIMFLGDVNAGYIPDNVTIKNCEIYGSQGNCYGNGNPGAIWAQFTGHDNPAYGLQVINCYIHDLQTINPGNGNLMGVITMNGSFGTTITNCTFTNCCPIASKDGWQTTSVSYCYLGSGGVLGETYYEGNWVTGAAGIIQNYVTGSGKTIEFHHNIIVGPIGSMGESSGQSNLGTVQIYNNTFYKPGAIGGKNIGLQMWQDGGAGGPGGGPPYGTFEFWNNLVYAADGNYDKSQNAGALWKLGASTGGTYSTISNTDCNAYGTGMTFAQDYTHQYDLGQWQGLGFGWDTHSILLSQTPFSGAPSESDYTTFALAPSSPAYTAGRNGAICGAVDGSGAVGCDFASVGSSQVGPNAPVLGTVS